MTDPLQTSALAPGAPAALAMAALLGVDLATRRIPNALVLALAAAGLGGALASWWTWSWPGAGAGLGLGLVAHLRGGDVKAAAVMGGFLGVPGIAAALAVALALTLWAWRRGLTEWPWMLALGAGAALVLFTGLFSAYFPSFFHGFSGGGFSF
jgi:hypothetical protein